MVLQIPTRKQAKQQDPHSMVVATQTDSSRNKSSLRYYQPKTMKEEGNGWYVKKATCCIHSPSPTTTPPSPLSVFEVITVPFVTVVVLFTIVGRLLIVNCFVFWSPFFNVAPLVFFSRRIDGGGGGSCSPPKRITFRSSTVKVFWRRGGAGGRTSETFTRPHFLVISMKCSTTE